MNAYILVIPRRATPEQPLNEEVVRQVIREELDRVAPR